MYFSRTLEFVFPICNVIISTKSDFLFNAYFRSYRSYWDVGTTCLLIEFDTFMVLVNALGYLLYLIGITYTSNFRNESDGWWDLDEPWIRDNEYPGSISKI